MDRIDAHLHLWSPDTIAYGWLQQAGALDRPCGLAELDAALDGAALNGFVFVEANCDPGHRVKETEWVLGLGAEDPRLLGVIAAAPLERGAAAARHLRELEALPGAHRIRGVRRLLQDEDDPRFCLRPEFLEGLRLLPDHDWSFDVCVYHHQLEAVVAMVERLPEVRFVLDHLGKPPVRAGKLDPWREQLARLAGHPNVVAKLSGLVTEADPAAWTEAQMLPFMEYALACFGAERLMFGGDWPVSTLATTWGEWAKVVERFLAGRSEDERAAVWCETARATYRLGG